MRLASRGARNMDTGIEQIEDERALAQVRRQARSVARKAILLGVGLTLLALLLPR